MSSKKKKRITPKIVVASAEPSLFASFEKRDKQRIQGFDKFAERVTGQKQKKTKSCKKWIQVKAHTRRNPKC